MCRVCTADPNSLKIIDLHLWPSTRNGNDFHRTTNLTRSPYYLTLLSSRAKIMELQQSYIMLFCFGSTETSLEGSSTLCFPNQTNSFIYMGVRVRVFFFYVYNILYSRGTYGDCNYLYKNVYTEILSSSNIERYKYNLHHI